LTKLSGQSKISNARIKNNPKNSFRQKWIFVN
jgi:hypothetical protein